MDTCALLFLLLICGCGNSCNKGQTTCTKPKEPEGASQHCCNDNNAGIIPPPWVRVEDGRDNQSCTCNHH